jgi:diguanylate cyclase (GGDEF)-like protein
MDHSPICRPLDVLLVSSDRGLLRGAGRFLGDFGYRTQAAADVALALASLSAVRPDFLVLDSVLGSPACLEVCRAASGDDLASSIYPILLLPRGSAVDLGPYVAAGVDDFLARPIVHGEFLARLRAGARFLEFERRLREVDGVEPRTGLANRPACLARLRRELADAALSAGATACAALQLDAYERLPLSHGRRAAEGALRQAAEALLDLAGETATVFALGDGRFAAVLPNVDVGPAAEWGESLRERLAEQSFEVSGQAWHWTVSIGVAGSRAAEVAADALLHCAEQALADACASGRNCVVVHGQFAADQRAWQEFRAPGKLFERTTAGDVMSACPIVLTADDSLVVAAEAMTQSDGGYLPVAGPDGRLLGVVARVELEAIEMESERTARKVVEILDPEAPSFAEETPFSAVMDVFVREGRGLAIVTRGERPVGQITRQGLASLIDTLSKDSFASQSPAAMSCDFLRVSDLAPQEA